MKTRVVIRADGSMRMIHSDALTPVLKLAGLDEGITRRASHVEPIQSGSNRGFWFADMSPSGFNYCLWPPRELREQALEDEHNHLVHEWLAVEP